MRIADDGKVLGAKLQLSALLDRGHQEFRSIGVKKASAFRKFCQEHDSKLFEPIETKLWHAEDQQLFLLGYRALCREIYAKRLVSEVALPVLRKYKPVTDLVAHDCFAEGTQQAVERLQRTKRVADAEIVKHRYRCSSAFFSLGSEFPMRASGVIHPEWDFNGNACFDLSSPTRFDILCITTHSTDRDVLAVFTWFTGSAILERFVDSFAQLEAQQRRASFAQLCFEHLEHTYLRPSWWWRIEPKERSQITKRFVDSMSPTYGRRADCLRPDAVFHCV